MLMSQFDKTANITRLGHIQLHQSNEVPKWFSDVWVPKVLPPPKKFKKLTQKAIFDLKYAFFAYFWVVLAVPVHLVPCCTIEYLPTSLKEELPWRFSFDH